MRIFFPLGYGITLLVTCCVGQSQPGVARPESSSAFASQEQTIAALNVICPDGKVAFSKNGKAAGCRQCPRGTSFRSDASDTGIVWTLQRATLGHFTSGTADELLVSGRGCEPHVYNFGGTYLLRGSTASWNLVRYNQGIIADRCIKVHARDGRDLPVCRDQDAHQGEQEDLVYLLRFDGAGEGKMEMIFEAVDTTGACPPASVGEVQQSSIDRVTYPDLNGDGRADLVIEVSFGKKRNASYDQDACYKAANSDRAGAVQAFFRVPIRHYRLEFLFDGTKFTPTLPTRAALKVVGAEVP